MLDGPHRQSISHFVEPISWLARLFLGSSSHTPRNHHNEPYDYPAGRNRCSLGVPSACGLYLRKQGNLAEGLAQGNGTASPAISVPGGSDGAVAALRHPVHKAREEFESAWPHILKVKSKGAPIVLRRGPSFWLGKEANAGVCIHTPPQGEAPITGDQVTGGRWEQTIYIELIVDGEIVDLNRIPLPADTPIIDERFKDNPKK